MIPVSVKYFQAVEARNLEYSNSFTKSTQNGGKRSYPLVLLMYLNPISQDSSRLQIGRYGFNTVQTKVQVWISCETRCGRSDLSWKMHVNFLFKQWETLILAKSTLSAASNENHFVQHLTRKHLRDHCLEIITRIQLYVLVVTTHYKDCELCSLYF